MLVRQLIQISELIHILIQTEVLIKTFQVFIVIIVMLKNMLIENI